MLTIEHETSPAIAAQVARTKRFLAGPILGDSGLNAVIVDDPRGPYHPQQAANCGAVMRFTWCGPVATGYYTAGYPPNQLFDEYPHRAFLPVGTNMNLKLIDIKLVSGSSWELEEDVAAIVRTQPDITICFPSGCCYRSIVTGKFPYHNWPN